MSSPFLLLCFLELLILHFSPNSSFQVSSPSHIYMFNLYLTTQVSPSSLTCFTTSSSSSQFSFPSSTCISNFLITSHLSYFCLYLYPPNHIISPSICVFHLCLPSQLSFSYLNLPSSTHKSNLLLLLVSPISFSQGSYLCLLLPPHKSTFILLPASPTSSSQVRFPSFACLSH